MGKVKQWIFISTDRIGLEPSSVRVCASICSCVNIFKHEYLKTSRLFAIKFRLKHHWGWGKAVLGFGPDRIRTLVSKGTWGQFCGQSSAFIFALIFFILAGKRNNHKISDEFKIRQDSTKDYGVSCSEGIE